MLHASVNMIKMSVLYER